MEGDDEWIRPTHSSSPSIRRTRFLPDKTSVCLAQPDGLIESRRTVFHMIEPSALYTN